MIEPPPPRFRLGGWPLWVALTLTAIALPIVLVDAVANRGDRPVTTTTTTTTIGLDDVELEGPPKGISVVTTSTTRPPRPVTTATP